MSPFPRGLVPFAVALAIAVSGALTPRASLGQSLAVGNAGPAHLPYVSDADDVFYKVNGQFLRPEAAAALVQMAEEARRDGVILVLRSGYRSRAEQSQLFYGGARARGISLAERARVSAPPGFSEHHTGFAVDLDDARDPHYLRQSFDRTKAGRWLIENASRFCFELSFPRGNPQGVTYEPWHWRFVGSEKARQVFAPARAMFAPDGLANRTAPHCGGGTDTAAVETETTGDATVFAASENLPDVAVD